MQRNITVQKGSFRHRRIGTSVRADPLDYFQISHLRLERTPTQRKQEPAKKMPISRAAMLKNRNSVPLPTIYGDTRPKEEQQQPQERTELRDQRIKTQMVPVEEESVLLKIVANLRKDPTRECLGQLARYLSEEIFPFTRLKMLTNLMLLNECCLKQYEPRQTIYKKGEPSKSIIFVMSGKVRLSDRSNNFCKVCRAGEILCEQALFPNSSLMSRVELLDNKELPKLETAKALLDTHILEIPVVRLEALNQSLLRNQFREEYHILSSLLWRSFISKTSLRREVCLK